MLQGGSSNAGTSYLDIDEMVKSMTYKLNYYLSIECSHVRVSKSCKISRVPEHIRKWTMGLMSQLCYRLVHTTMDCRTC